MALRLGHRTSEDFDFFSNEDFRPDDLERQGIELSQALGAARAVYGESFNPLLSLKALTYFRDGDLRKLPESVQSRLTQAVRNVDPDRLPRIDSRAEGVAP